jgi:hypothetical protein
MCALISVTKVNLLIYIYLLFMSGQLVLNKRKHPNTVEQAAAATMTSPRLIVPVRGRWHHGAVSRIAKASGTGSEHHADFRHPDLKKKPRRSGLPW